MLTNVPPRLAHEEPPRTANEATHPPTTPSNDTMTVSSSSDETTHADPPVDLDELFEVLSNRRRRDVIRYLDSEAAGDGETAEIAIGTLAEVIAARENDKRPRTVTSAERKRVYIALYQCHLPKMTATDVIDYDSRSGQTAHGPTYDTFLRFLPPEAAEADSQVGPGIGDP